MSDSPNSTNPRPVFLDLEFARSYFRQGESRDHFIIATPEGQEAMIARKSNNGITTFEPITPEHAWTAEIFTKVNFHYETLANQVRV
ncbi:MAG: hypothetical protein ACKVS6_16215 [Planctomycetota bacterium]